MIWYWTVEVLPVLENVFKNLYNYNSMLKVFEALYIAKPDISIYVTPPLSLLALSCVPRNNRFSLCYLGQMKIVFSSLFRAGSFVPLWKAQLMDLQRRLMSEVFNPGKDFNPFSENTSYKTKTQLSESTWKLQQYISFRLCLLYYQRFSLIYKHKISGLYVKYTNFVVFMVMHNNSFLYTDNAKCFMSNEIYVSCRIDNLIKSVVIFL